jgi:hypothetical protein
MILDRSTQPIVGCVLNCQGIRYADKDEANAPMWQVSSDATSQHDTTSSLGPSLRDDGGEQMAYDQN